MHEYTSHLGRDEAQISFPHRGEIELRCAQPRSSQAPAAVKSTYMRNFRPCLGAGTGLLALLTPTTLVIHQVQLQVTPYEEIAVDLCLQYLLIALPIVMEGLAKVATTS